MCIKSCWFALLTVFVFLCGHTLFAQPKGTGTIAGTVVEHRTGDRLPGGYVWVLGTRFFAEADSTGRFIIRNVPPGIYPLLTKYIGFASRRDDSVVVRAGDTVWMQLRLQDMCAVWADSARKDIAAGKVHLLVVGLLVRTVPEDDLNELTRKYGFEYLPMGCDFFCGRAYNEAVEEYLEARNGANWWDRYDAEYKERFDD